VVKGHCEPTEIMVRGQIELQTRPLLRDALGTALQLHKLATAAPCQQQQETRRQQDLKPRKDNRDPERLRQQPVQRRRGKANFDSTQHLITDNNKGRGINVIRIGREAACAAR
jgi:hypothetical protein